MAINVLLTTLPAHSQSTDRYWKEIGMRITLPAGPVYQDEFAERKYFDDKGEPLTDTAQIRKLEEKLWKPVLFVQAQDNKSSASFNIVRQTTETGDSAQFYNFSIRMQSIMARQLTASVDTSSAFFNISGTHFYKFLTRAKISGTALYSGMYLAKRNDYFLVIKVDYTDINFGEAIEKAIKSADFN